MFKILVALWFLKMLFSPLTKHIITRILLSNSGEIFKELNIYSDTKTDNLNSEQSYKLGTAIIQILIALFINASLFIIEFILLLFMLKYDNTYITLLYIALCIIKIIYNTIETKIKNIFNKNKSINLGEQLLDMSKSIEKTTFKKFILKTLNILYWGYAVYLLFI